MKFLFSNATHDWGGGKSWALETASGLARRGHECTMLGRPADAWLEACRDAGLATREVSFGPVIFEPVGLIGFYRVARKFQPDCIVVNSSYDMCAGAVAGALLGIPLVRVVGCGADLSNAPVDRWLHTRQLRGTIAVDHETKREMLERCRWLDEEHVEVIHIGKDTDVYRPEKRDDLRKEWSIQENELLLGVTNQLEERQGHAVLFEALAKLGSDRLHLAVVGRGGRRDSLARLVETLGLSDRVRFLGPRHDLPRLLQCLDVFVLPSFSEDFPNGLVEAMATGLPCISTELACASEIVDHEQNGLLVRVGDSNAMAEALGRISAEPELRRRLGASARRTVEERFSIESTTDRCEAYLSKLVDSCSSGGRSLRKGAVSKTPAEATGDLLLLRERFAWMGRYSGYDRLFDEIEPLWENRVDSVFRTRSPLKNLLFEPLAFVSPPRAPFYNGDSAAAELAALRQVRRNGSRLVHVAYVENNLRRFVTHRPHEQLRVVGTAHQPAEWWRNRHGHPELVAALDALIVMSRAQQAYFEELMPGRVHFVPHGVDTIFFSPSPDEPSSDRSSAATARCVFSGGWLRDFGTLRRVVEAVLAKRPATRFDMIAPTSHRDHPDLVRLAELEEVVWHEGLSDEELRGVYRGARLLLLPLLDTTVNNALLEAAACGLPVVTTDVGGVRDYTEPSFASRLPGGDVEGLIHEVLQLIDDADLARERGRAARAYAERELTWSQVAQQTLAIYEAVLDAPR